MSDDPFLIGFDDGISAQMDPEVQYAGYKEVVAKKAVQAEIERMLGYTPLTVVPATWIDTPDKLLSSADLLAFYYECHRFRPGSAAKAAQDLNLVVPEPVFPPGVSAYMQHLIEMDVAEVMDAWIAGVRQELVARKQANAGGICGNIG